MSNIVWPATVQFQKQSSYLLVTNRIFFNNLDTILFVSFGILMSFALIIVMLRYPPNCHYYTKWKGNMIHSSISSFVCLDIIILTVAEIYLELFLQILLTS
jgi:hypothetical protein